MASNRSLNSVFKSVLVGGSMIALTILPSGCNSINNKTLSSEQAQTMVSSYVTEHNGSVSNIQGVVQNEGSSQAVATISVSDFNYTVSNGAKAKYTGKAIAQFSRYTDGKWSMTDVTINPDDVFSARHFTISNQSSSPNASAWVSIFSDPGGFFGIVFGILALGVVVSSPIIIVYYFNQRKSSLKKES
jgi:hypothetical protein